MCVCVCVCGLNVLCKFCQTLAAPAVSGFRSGFTLREFPLHARHRRPLYKHKGLGLGLGGTQCIVGIVLQLGIIIYPNSTCLSPLYCLVQPADEETAENYYTFYIYGESSEQMNLIISAII